MLDGTPENTATRAVVSSLNQFYEVLYSGAMFLTDTELERLQKACTTFGPHYLQLRALAVRHVRPKHHKMQHAPLFCLQRS